MLRRHEYELNNVLDDVVVRGFATIRMSKLQRWFGPNWSDPETNRKIAARFRKLCLRFDPDDDGKQELFFYMGNGEILLINGDQIQNIEDMC